MGLCEVDFCGTLLQDVSSKDLKSSGSLLEAYSLSDQTEHSAATSLNSQRNNESNDFPTANEVVINVYFLFILSYSYINAEAHYISILMSSLGQ